MRKILLLCLILCCYVNLKAQTTIIAPGEYKNINIGFNEYGDYTRNLILLHEIYNGVNIDKNYAIGTITALRGTAVAFDRINVAMVNSSSAYMSHAATLTSFDDVGSWQLKTCMYNGKKYLAVDVPYADAYHNWGYKFTGWTSSTAESMKSVAYMLRGTPINQQIISDIQDYIPNISETHFVYNFNVLGNVGIGTTTPKEKLSVNGNIRAKEVKVETTNWPDYVFDNGYQTQSLPELENYIKTNKHLPDMPSAKEIEANGVAVGDMLKLQQQKIEELTLHLIEKDKQLKQEKEINKKQEDRIALIEEKLNIKK